MQQQQRKIMQQKGLCSVQCAVCKCTMYIQCIVRLRGIHILYFRVHAVTLRIVQECPDAKVCARAVIAPR